MHLPHRTLAIRFALYLPAAILIGWLIFVRASSSRDPAPFQPPSAQQRRAAIGATARLAPVLQRAFRESESFEPLPAPKPGEWLAAHPEYGQPYERFLRAGPQRPDQKRRVLYLQPLGEFVAGEGPALDTLQQFAAEFFCLPVTVLPAADIAEAKFTSRINRSSGHKQLLTDDLLAWLADRLPGDAYAILGVTMVDLYPAEDWNFVFGQASLRNRVGVYSFARFHPRFFGRPAGEGAEALQLRRSCQVLAHEAGHMFGMEHCVYYRCLMNGANHQEESDSQPLHLCPVCLHKLHTLVGFDILQRYQKLLAFSRQAGFTEEAAWLARRLQELRGSQQQVPK